MVGLMDGWMWTNGGLEGRIEGVALMVLYPMLLPVLLTTVIVIERLSLFFVML
jgi:hypothetical protein